MAALIVAIIGAVAAWKSFTTSEKALQLQAEGNNISAQSFTISEKALQLQGEANKISAQQLAFQEWSQYKMYWDYCNIKGVSPLSVPRLLV